MIRTIAKCTVKEGFIEAFNEITDKMVKDTNLEPGSIKYELYKDVKNVNVYYFIEDWVDKTGFKAHLNSEAFKESYPKLMETLEKEMELTRLELEK